MIKDKIRFCEFCQQNKGPVNREESAFIFEIGKYPKEKIQTDILEPLPETKRRNKYVITTIDTCTRYLFVQALIEFLKNVFSKKGIPRIIQTDNGKNFISIIFQDFLKLYGIIHKRSTYFHPQTQEIVKRMNKTL